jgi:L-ascorbate metabolism protein UlaG (beta-lactamase superfamily)
MRPARMNAFPLLPLFLLVLLTQWALRPALAGDAAGAVTITYIANDGFLVSGGSQKVLIDALMAPHSMEYNVPSPDLLARMETATAPFDGIVAVLVTHPHADHFNAKCVAAHLTDNPTGVFLSTRDAVNKVREVDPALESRTRPVTPTEMRQSRTEKVDGISIDALWVDHGRPGFENLAFVIHMNGLTLLHTGDSANWEDFRSFDWQKTPVDVVFASLWPDTAERQLDFLENVIKPRVVVLMHYVLSRDLEAARQIAEKARPRFERVIVFGAPGETATVSARTAKDLNGDLRPDAATVGFVWGSSGLAPAPPQVWLNTPAKPPAPVAYGHYRTIYSKILGEDRRLLIRLPADYDKSEKKYPVLYKLDGYKDVFIQTCAALDYLVDDMTKKAPEHIVVGIENTDRGRDMQPGPGADKFLLFIKSELFPFIERDYRTSGFEILGGQSSSSVFALYSFLKEPELFDAFILSSFGLYNADVTSVFEQQLKISAGLRTVGRKYIFVAGGKHDSLDPDGSIGKRGSVFLDSLMKIVPASVLLESKVYEDEGHVPFPSTYDGLKWIYSQEKAATSQE